MAISALDSATSQFRTNFSNTSLGKITTRAAAPVSNFVKQATSLFAPNKQINIPSLNYKVNNVQLKQSPIVKNFITSAQKGIQNWAQKNPARAQNIINAPSKLTQTVTEPIASIPYRISDAKMKLQKTNMVPVSYKKMNKEGNLWDNKINSLPVAQQQPVANLIWGESDFPNPISGSSANLQTQGYNTDKSDPALEAIKQKILAGENIRPSAKEYLSQVPIEYAKLFTEAGQPTSAGVASGAGTPNRRILINEDFIKPQMRIDEDGTKRIEHPEETTTRINGGLDSVIKHELLHHVPEGVSLKTFKPENKTIINNYVNQWSKKYMNDKNGKLDTKRLVGEMFAEQSLPPAYYWHVYKQVVPNAKPSTFLQTIKSYFINNINTKESSVIPSKYGTMVPNSGGQPVLNQ